MLWGDGEKEPYPALGLDNMRIQLCGKSKAGCSRQGYCHAGARKEQVWHG